MELTFLSLLAILLLLEDKVLLQILSVAMNTYGRYNLAKTFMVVGYLNVVIAISFLWVVRFINEGLLLAYNVYTVQDRRLFYLNFGKVGDRAPYVLYILLVFGWAILMGRNFPLFDYLSRPLLSYLSEERSIGDYSFSINGLALFIIIMVISVITSKIVSFFASDDHLSASKEESKGRGLGSWILLVRIFILSIGLFLAIAAAGIPLDKITIVMGALGVGVGFGLQTLVNNLVSGLIIAFEKPVNVGDVVDVDGQGGTMKSIGFRSSVISTWDGADLVMPNGDLLNSHLMNWTLAGSHKRTKISIDITASTDLQHCKVVISELLDKDDRILKNPKYFLQFEQITGGVVELNIYFWTRYLKDSSAAKSDIIESIIRVFKMHKIDISIPQQDVFIHQSSKDDKTKR
ncbi:MAG: mechanosensitive ion channel [Pedobacter sp.]|nr:MAG: mechanosensitive ion channel [Pedobacter sp.]